MEHDGKTPANFNIEPLEMQDVDGPVPARWRGTEEDKLQMKVLGRTQETRRIFNFISMLGFNSTLMVTWVRQSSVVAVSTRADHVSLEPGGNSCQYHLHYYQWRDCRHVLGLPDHRRWLPSGIC